MTRWRTVNYVFRCAKKSTRLINERIGTLEIANHPLLAARHFHMLDKLLSNALDGITLNEVRRFDASSLSFDRLGGPMVLLCNLVSNADDRAVRGVCVEVIIEILQSPIRGLWV